MFRIPVMDTSVDTNHFIVSLVFSMFDSLNTKDLGIASSEAIPG